MQTAATIYFGDIAAGYEDERVRDPLWTKEHDILGPVLSSAFRSGERVIDLAAGTGRWLDLYKAAGVRPTLIDISSDMLASALARARRIELTLESVIEGNVFEMASLPDAEWLVCTRFFNWIPHAHVERVLALAAAAGVRSVAFTVRCLDDDAGRDARLESVRYWREKNRQVRAGTRNKGHYYLQSSRRLRQTLARHGFTLVAEHVIERIRGDKYLLFVGSHC